MPSLYIRNIPFAFFQLPNYEEVFDQLPAYHISLRRTFEIDHTPVLTYLSEGVYSTYVVSR
jgi:hypothetical protein